MKTNIAPKGMKYEQNLPSSKILDNSPEIEENFSGLKKIPYNLIPSKDSIEHDRQIKTDDNIIIPVPLEKELHEDSHLLLSNVPSRRHSRIEPDSTNPDKRKSIVSGSIDIKMGIEEKKEPDIDVFKAYDYPETKFKQFLEKLLTNWIFQLVVSIFTIWCLFADDFKLIFAPKDPGDMAFDVINIFCMSLFLLEIVMSSIARKQYFLSFFFFMDLISTFIIVFDLSWVQTALLSSQSSLNTQKKIPSASLKIMKIIRLIRLIRLLKLFKAFQEKNRNKNIERLITIENHLREARFKMERRTTRFSITEINMEKMKNEQLLAEKEKLLVKETRIGTKILDRTVKLSIVMVLILVFCGPIFDSSFFFDYPKGYTIDLKIMSNLGPNNVDRVTMQSFYNYYIQTEQNVTYPKYPLIHCEVPILNATFNSMDISTLRSQEMEIYTIAVPYMAPNFISIVDLRSFTHYTSIINILRTFYVAVVLLMTCYLFNKDLNLYVITPLSRMIMNINQIANNPLSSKEHFFVRKNHSDVTYETDFIEEAILKTGVLLALGLGEAGASSISKNISNDGDLVATMPGKKTFAIFGFCDIRNFTDSTEILQEEVMVFVNSIAEVVHGMVDKYGGSANKNIGDAFLMVWKFPKNEIITNEEGNLTLKKGRVVKNVTDLALISFLKIICALNNMPRFLKYRLHPGLNSRIANYQIKMGFGLHLGWAIEGTIGSEYKIDASYLSPNVNMAARLEAATKQYKSLLLVSNDFMEYTSKETRRYCREIDRVTVKGSIKPVGLFTVDMDLSNLVIAEPLAKDKRASFVERKSLMERIENLSEKMHELLDIDRDLVVALKVCKGQFKDAFDQGFLKYIAGDWKEAKEILEKCLLMRPNDGPSGVLMSVMGEEGFEPKNWQGYRVLTDK